MHLITPSQMTEGLFLFITGLSLFLFAMIRLSAEMQKLFSLRIRTYIKFAVTRPVFGILMGTAATILFQSSSAATLLTISIVSAGLISFSHSLAIILGADIGTTLTAQLVVWNVTTISPLFIFAGVLLGFLGKEKWKTAGEAIFYFGLIFFGLSLIGEATVPLKQNKAVVEFFAQARNPFLGLAVGAVFTGLVHASAIPISILIIMSQQGFITIENALPIVVGANIGTTVTALMGSMVTNINGKRSALSHLFFKCSGAVISLLFLPLFISLLQHLFSNTGQQIAVGHFLFNLLITLLFVFILKPFAAFVERVLPGKDQTLPLWPEYLDEECLTSPEDALACVKRELEREIFLAGKMLEGSLALLSAYNKPRRRDVMYIEMVVDNLQAEITRYLWHISCGELSPPVAKKLFAFAAMVYDIERMGDHAINLVELSESKFQRKAEFSIAATVELKEIEQLVVQNLADAAALIAKKDTETINAIGNRAEEVKLKVKAAIEKHLERFYQKLCRAEAGPIFVDMLINLERISDHCLTIAAYIRGLDDV